ncbi:MAG: D-glucuronyl C5-epimerase family protein [Gemmatimonadota bacterium]|nr:D-glucuronyl C5-epimerase family protein [Gemmatimonadota bacterium]
MNSTAQRVRALWENYVVRRVRGRPSPVTFWFTPEPPRVVDPDSLARYLADQPHPRYLMDYTAKVAYQERNEAGMLVLHYPDPVGTHVNPEAAFQQALGAHDQWRETGERALHDTFLRTADWFQRDQTDHGRWLYRFDWHRSTAPWTSALAQMRGASVMLRAWQLTGEDRYRAAALLAAEPLYLDLADGGMRSIHPSAAVAYFEEYPAEPTAVLNGFMASLFGLFELATWLHDRRASEHLESGYAALETMLPHYCHRGWTLYDLDPASPFPNPNSPRYHRLVADYLRVLASISGRPGLAEWRDRWIAMDTAPNRARAVVGKTLRKVRYK